MAAKMSEARRRAFFAALAATGNQTIAAERARMSRSWVRLHRTRDPAFRQVTDEAVAVARAKLAEAGGIAPPKGWGSLDGEELTVRGGNGRRVQVMRARLDAFSPRAACAAIGISPAAVYRQRQRRRDFAERWDRAIEAGYDRLEMGLLERCGSLFAEEEIDLDLADVLVAGPITVKQAMQLWFHHRPRVHGIGSRRKRRETPIEEMRAEILRRVAVLKRCNHPGYGHGTGTAGLGGAAAGGVKRAPVPLPVRVERRRDTGRWLATCPSTSLGTDGRQRCLIVAAVRSVLLTVRAEPVEGRPEALPRVTVLRQARHERTG